MKRYVGKLDMERVMIRVASLVVEQKVLSISGGFSYPGIEATEKSLAKRALWSKLIAEMDDLVEWTELP